jgi:16S rRNA (adenine1518-N6/adenine1519-N6)-dimethyltransferase
VASALVRLERRREAADERLARLVHAAFAHRRKPLASSLELAGVGPGRERVAATLGELGLRADVRAEALAPERFAALARALADRGKPGRSRRRSRGIGRP